MTSLRVAFGRPDVRYLIVAVGAALVLRLCFIVLFAPDKPEFDGAVYDQMAGQILNGEGVHAHGMLALRPPLYAAFLAGVYATLGPVMAFAQAVQVGLSLTLLVLLFVLTRTLFDGRAAALALAVAAVHPQLVRYPSLLLSENLYLPLFAGALVLLVRFPTARGWLGAGVVFGLAALVRELALPVVVLIAAGSIAIAAVRSRAEVRVAAIRAACLLAGLTLAIAPWTLRNYLVLDAFVPITTNFGWVLWLGYNPISNGYYHSFVSPRGVSGDIQVSQYYMSAAIEWMWQNPGAAVHLTLYRAWLFWRPYFIAGPDDGRLGVLFAAAKTAAVLVTFAGAAIAWRRWLDPRLLPIVVLCLVSTAAHAATHMEVGGRYRLPVETALIPVAAAGLAHLRLGGFARALPAPVRSPHLRPI